MSDATINNAAGGKFVMCKEPGCTVAVDGACYEGLADLAQCSNYVPLAIGDEQIAALEAASDEDAEAVEPSEEFPTSVNLFTGGELDYAGSLRIMLNALTRVVVLAGPNDSGKTTLLASIFEHFLRGALAGYLFAGGETSPAFDRRCHLSRTDSGRRTEDTERTKSFSEQTMLHLRVRDEALRNPARDLLFSDLRGELFNEAIKSSAEARRIKVLKRADHFVLLVDGAKLADLGSRNQAATAAGMTLRSLAEAGMIGGRTLVEVLFTKDDLIRRTDAENETSEFLQALEEDIKRKHEHQFARLRFRRVAARTAEGVDSYGVPELFRGWVEDSAYTDTRAGASRDGAPRVVTSEREFDRYAVGRLPERFVGQRGGTV